MAKKLEDLLSQIEKPLAETLRNLPPILGEEVVNFAHDNFDRQSFNGIAWEKRKNPTKWGKRDDEGRSLLMKKFLINFYNLNFLTSEIKAIT